MNQTVIVHTLQSRLPNLLAVYAFGSRVQGTAGPGSDLDLAVLVAGYAEPLTLWTLAGDLADVAACPVDVLDLRAASTVMQYQVIRTGQRWWAADGQAEHHHGASGRVFAVQPSRVAARRRAVGCVSMATSPRKSF